MLLTKMRSTMSEDEAGQALVVGAFTMLILALSVMVTFQMGHTINERIRVQNAADNGAFSVGAVVARSLNFISFVNRAMIVHYVYMMAWVSVSSTLTALRGLTGLLSDTILTMSVIACLIKTACQLCEGVPFVFPVCIACYGIFYALEIALYAIGTVLQKLSDNVLEKVDTTTDQPLAILVSVMQELNYTIMFMAQVAMKLATTASLALIATGTGNNFEGVVMNKTACNPGESTCVNSGNSTATAYNLGMAFFNAGSSYTKMFDGKSLIYGGNQSEKGAPEIKKGGSYYDTKTESDNGMQRADRLMTALANGTRTGLTGDLHWESHRSLLGYGAISDAAGFLGMYQQGSTRITLPQSDCEFSEQSTCHGGSSGGAKQSPTADCDKKKKVCTDYDTNTYQPAKAKCDSDTSAYNSCVATCTPTPCTKCGSQQSSMNSSCSDAADKKSTLDDKCDDAKDACDFEKNGANAGALSDLSPSGKKNFALQEYAGFSSHNRGAVIQAAEYVKSSGIGAISGGGAARIFGVQVSNESNDRFHCRYDGRDSISSGVCKDFQYSKPTNCKKESYHSWYGITRYVSFHPEDDTTSLFNQPDYWGLVNKAPDKARLHQDLAFGFGDSGSGNWTFSWGTGGSATLTGMNQPGYNGSFMKGINAWSRAQVYYHRPGAWTEPPNFFNPFWKSKLAPVGPKISALLKKVGLSGIPGMSTAVNAVLVH